MPSSTTARNCRNLLTAGRVPAPLPIRAAPGGPAPTSGLLPRNDGPVRHVYSTYDRGMVYYPEHSVSEGRSLDATRRILVSPFPEDGGSALYLAGHEGPHVDNRTARVYRLPLTLTGGGPERP